jgi:hypothetical protein
LVSCYELLTKKEKSEGKGEKTGEKVQRKDKEKNHYGIPPLSPLSKRGGDPWKQHPTGATPGDNLFFILIH